MLGPASCVSMFEPVLVLGVFGIWYMVIAHRLIAI